MVDTTRTLLDGKSHSILPTTEVIPSLPHQPCRRPKENGHCSVRAQGFKDSGVPFEGVDAPLSRKGCSREGMTRQLFEKRT